MTAYLSAIGSREADSSGHRRNDKRSNRKQIACWESRCDYDHVGGALNPVPTGTNRRSAPVESEETLEASKTKKRNHFTSHGVGGGVGLSDLVRQVLCWRIGGSGKPGSFNMRIRLLVLGTPSWGARELVRRGMLSLEFTAR